MNIQSRLKVITLNITQ